MKKEADMDTREDLHTIVRGKEEEEKQGKMGREGKVRKYKKEQEVK